MTLDIDFPQSGDVVGLSLVPEGRYNLGDSIVLMNGLGAGVTAEAASINFVLYNNTTNAVIDSKTLAINPNVVSGDWTGPAMTAAANTANCKLTALLTITVDGETVSGADQVEGFEMNSDANEGANGVSSNEQ